MDPLTALSLAGNIIKFVDFGSKLVSKAGSLYKSASGEEAQEVLLELETLSKDLYNLADHIQNSKTAPAEDLAFISLGKECCEVSDDLLSVIRKSKIKAPSKRWRNFGGVLKSERKEAEIEAFESLRESEKTLDRIRNAVNTQILFNLSPKVFQTLENLEAQNRQLEAARSGDIRAHTKIIKAHLEDMEKLAKGLHQGDITAQSLKELSVSAEVMVKYSAEQRILESLYFDTMEDRHTNIRPPHEKTFSWIFQSSASMGKSCPAPHFVEWMVSKDPLYWISGTAGSGKSTLMKYIYNHDLTRNNLRQWSGGSRLIVAKFFFGALSMTELPKSREGLLRSMLYQMLGQCPDLIPSAFPSQWQVCTSRDPHLQERERDHDILRLPELLTAFESVSSDLVENKIKICFFIDGLDEYEGQLNEIIHLIETFKSLPNIKTCVSSRPWNRFETAFGQISSWKLYMQEFTKPDIERYVRDTFEKHVNYQEVQKRDDSTLDLVKNVSDKANGVFLWVYIVVQSLLDAPTIIVSGDIIYGLQSRLRLFPRTLEGLFKYIFEGIHQSHHGQAAHMLLATLAAQKSLPLLAYSFIELEGLEFAVELEAKPWSMQKIDRESELMRKRLNACCKGLLQVQFDNSDESVRVSLSPNAPFQRKVTFLHRTVRDFLLEKDTQILLADWAGPSFDVDITICKALLAQIKAVPQDKLYLHLHHNGPIGELVSIFLYHASTSVRDELAETQRANLLTALYGTLQHFRGTIGPRPAVITKLNSEDLDPACENPLQATKKPPGVISRLPTYRTFDSLIHEVDALMELYRRDKKMAFIRQKVGLALRRESASPSFTNRIRTVVFRTAWDLQQFLRDNYELDSQSLARAITITGHLSDAQMCTTGQYLQQTWPSMPVELLLALYEALDAPYDSLKSPVSPGFFARQQIESIHADLTSNIIEVCGSEGFIISIGQQIAWLAAACSLRPQHEGIVYADVYLDELQDARDGILEFIVAVNVENPSPNEGRSCWNSIVGSTTLIVGFPILRRENEERGLEISVQLMTALVGIPEAVTYITGYVFKGKYHAFIPVGKSETSIQWHLINTYPKRLKWTDIDEHCPGRISVDLDSDDASHARNFLGWCSPIICLLATDEYPFDSTFNSSAMQSSRLWGLEVVKFTLGFNKVATGSVDITLGRRNGVNFDQRSDYYDDILERAKDVPVIIHGTDDFRAIQSDGEELILQILLHQKHRGRFAGEDQNLAITPADPFRRTMTVRKALLNNADMVIRQPYRSKDPGRAKVLFKEEAVVLCNRLDGLQANLYPQKGSSLKLGFPGGRSVYGFEYMDLLSNKIAFDPKRIELKNTCGDWHKYARDIRALPLFMANLGDIVKPGISRDLCQTFQSLPGDRCFLGVRVPALLDLFDEQGCRLSQTKLTRSGLTLLGPPNVFDSCPSAAKRGQRACTCTRTHRIISSTKLSKRFEPRTFQVDGAIIIGGEVDKQTTTPNPHYDDDRTATTDISQMTEATVINDDDGIHSPVADSCEGTRSSDLSELNSDSSLASDFCASPLSITREENYYSVASGSKDAAGTSLQSSFYSLSSGNIPLQPELLDEQIMESSNRSNVEITTPRSILTPKGAKIGQQRTVLFYSQEPSRSSLKQISDFARPIQTNQAKPPEIISPSGQAQPRTDDNLQAEHPAILPPSTGSLTRTSRGPGKSEKETAVQRQVRKRPKCYDLSHEKNDGIGED